MVIRQGYLQAVGSNRIVTVGGENVRALIEENVPDPFFSLFFPMHAARCRASCHALAGLGHCHGIDEGNIHGCGLRTYPGHAGQHFSCPVPALDDSFAFLVDPLARQSSNEDRRTHRSAPRTTMKTRIVVTIIGPEGVGAQAGTTGAMP